MGFLTTFTVRNDFLQEIEKNPVEFTKRVVEMCHRMKGDPEKCYDSDIIPQFTRHADDHTTYVHMGNTVCEMNPYSKETQKLMASHPEFFQKMLKFMESEVKEMKKQFKLSKQMYKKVR